MVQKTTENNMSVFISEHQNSQDFNRSFKKRLTALSPQNNEQTISINSERSTLKSRLKSKGKSIISNFNGSNRTVYIENPDIPENMP